MKAVYDAWTADIPDAPQSEYLVVSRRCSSMAALSSFEDILDIARITYYPNTLAKLLMTRYGVNPSPEKWQEISQTVKLGPKSIIEIQDKKIGNLKAVLTILQEEIFAQVAKEQNGLSEQLNEIGLAAAINPAVVDVGYGGTVQGHVNKVLKKALHGYYLLTEERASVVSNRYGVNIQGCFGENISGIDNAPMMFRLSFELEKLLSSNDAQIEFYELKDGHPVGHYRPLTPAELEPALFRDNIRTGALKYVSDLREIRQNLLPDFQPSCFVASSLMDAFLGNLSDNERALLSRIVLDDYYCGRDLVA